MPKGRSTFNKRQKEQARQQKQRDKALRRTERKETKPEGGPADDMNDLHQHAAEQAALFRVGQDENQAADSTNDSADQENH